MGLVRTEGIVLRTKPLGEADKIVVLFSRDYGKIETVARGARRPRSRLVGAAQPFSYLKVLFFSGKSLHQLSQAQIIKSFAPLRDDLTHMTYAAYWTELIDTFLPLDEPNQDIFLFLLAGLVVLEKSTDPTLISRAFELRLLLHLGYLPTLESCAHCGSSPITAAAGFSPEEGGLICSSCRQKLTMKPLSISEEGIRLMQDLIHADLRKVSSWPLSPRLNKEISRALQLFIEYRAEKPLKSLAFLQSTQVP